MWGRPSDTPSYECPCLQVLFYQAYIVADCHLALLSTVKRTYHLVGLPPILLISKYLTCIRQLFLLLIERIAVSVFFCFHF